ncbi:MAG: TonB-dependent receptor [Saprospiraceae bacterium]|nr:TonB-dependent receptor [Saprospiraceae bacterium]MCB9322798.1 TonB-dependent receptor [Lewinellaceae bacterium]
MSNMLDTDQKALEINLNEQIYGTFAEIGAGQEVARIFFKVGAAAGTIAKTMSAYDKTYSDEIYGVETSGRYVCESRVEKMLDHEYGLLTKRLSKIRPQSTFFVFADTVATLNFSRTIQGNGWLGIRFQLKPDGPSNDIILHVRMLDNTTSQQQSAVGILGVNLLYGIYAYTHDPEKMICSLVDEIRGRVHIDMVRLSGPDFDLDNRLLAYWLVKHDLAPITMFNAMGETMHASNFLYKKNIMVVRSNFRPITVVTENLIQNGFEQFCEECEAKSGEDAFIFTEMMPAQKGEEAKNDEKDFIERADMLSLLGHSVIVSNCREHERLVDYLSEFKFKKLGIAMGAKKVQKLILEKYEKYFETSLLLGFGKLFRNKVVLYVYPAQPTSEDKLLTSQNIETPPDMKFLYQHLLHNGRIVDIRKFRKEILHIFTKTALKKLRKGEEGWEQLVPKAVANYIKEKKALGYKGN